MLKMPKRKSDIFEKDMAEKAENTIAILLTAYFLPNPNIV